VDFHDFQILSLAVQKEYKFATDKELEITFNYVLMP
jgi:hypothetical protein